jgi:hypothetical protein
MAESVVPGKPQKPHGLDWRPVVNDYRARAGRSGTSEIEASDLATGEPRAEPRADLRPDPRPDPKTAPDENEDSMVSPINLRKFQEQLNRNRLDEIAALVLALTYGEMIEMANAIWETQPDGAVITQDNLPARLHRWSKSRSLMVDSEVSMVAHPD